MPSWFRDLFLQTAHLKGNYFVDVFCSHFNSRSRMPALSVAILSETPFTLV